MLCPRQPSKRSCDLFCDPEARGDFKTDRGSQHLNWKLITVLGSPDPPLSPLPISEVIVKFSSLPQWKKTKVSSSKGGQDLSAKTGWCILEVGGLRNRSFYFGDGKRSKTLLHQCSQVYLLIGIVEHLLLLCLPKCNNL